MTLRKQLRWGGLFIIVAAVLMNGTTIMVYLGKHNAVIQAVYGIGFTGLILSSAIIHIAQARRSGVFGLLAYLISVLSLAFANVVTFLILAELAGIEGAHETLVAVSNPVMNLVIYGIIVGQILMGISIAQAGVLPRGAGIIAALGVALQFPTMYALDTVGPLYFIFTIGGSILFATGLIWIGWTLWSNHFSLDEEPRLSNLDRGWGAPFIILTAILSIVNAYVNSFDELTLSDGIINLISLAALMLSIVILHTAHADRAGRLGLAGFFFTHLGATLSIIPAYLIMAQLAGQIESNRALMASWVDIPIGRYGDYMVIFGILLFGIAVIRAEVFPRWSGWLIVIGSAISLPTNFQAQAYLFIIFWAVGATLQGIGLGWMGWSLFKKNPLVE